MSMVQEMLIDAHQWNEDGSFNGKVAYEVNEEYFIGSDTSGNTELECVLKKDVSFFATDLTKKEKYSQHFREKNLARDDAGIGYLRKLDNERAEMIFLLPDQKLAMWNDMSVRSSDLENVVFELTVDSLGFTGSKRPKNAWPTATIPEFQSGVAFQFDGFEARAYSV